MKLNLKQKIDISWVWYFTQMIFWICLCAFFIWGVYILMSSKTTDKEEMQGDAGAAVFAIFFILCSIGAILQTMCKHPKKRIEMRMDWTGGPSHWKERPVTYWDNVIKTNP